MRALTALLVAVRFLLQVATRGDIDGTAEVTTAMVARKTTMLENMVARENSAVASKRALALRKVAMKDSFSRLSSGFPPVSSMALRKKPR